MTLVLVEVPNEAAIEALRRQPDVRVVGVVEPTVAQTPAGSSVASLIGSISPEAGKRMLRDTAKLRDEWERES